MLGKEIEMIKDLFCEKIQKVGMYNEWEMLPYLIREQGFKWFIYGAGENGRFICDLVERIYHLKPDFFVDRYKAEAWSGVEVYTIEKLMTVKLEKCIAVISPCKYMSSVYIRDDINKILYEFERKCEKFIGFYGGHICDHFKPDWYYYIKENTELFERTYRILEDDFSKQTYLDFLRIYVLGERYPGITMPEEYKYWGIDSDKKFIKFLDNEVLLNLGACAGDTVYQFLKLKTKFKKIIAVEGDEIQFDKLKKSIFMLDNELQTRIQYDNYLVGEGKYTIDKLYLNENITLIIMYIEGAELSVLHSAEQIIKKDRPVLSVCVYHKKDDLIEIPKYIQSIVSDYVYILRKYPSEMYAWGGKTFYIDYMQQNNELVLYAIPRERYIG